MIESIEGKRGMPRLRPPYVAQVGLFGRPTLEHNMETLYWVRDILEKGAAWFAGQGRQRPQGLALVLGVRPRGQARRASRAGGHHRPRADRRVLRRHAAGPRALRLSSGRGVRRDPAGLARRCSARFRHAAAARLLHRLGRGDRAVAARPRARRRAQPDAFFRRRIVRSMHAMPRRHRKGRGAARASRTGTCRCSGELSQAMADASICGLGQAAPNPIACVVHYFPARKLRSRDGADERRHRVQLNGGRARRRAGRDDHRGRAAPSASRFRTCATRRACVRTATAAHAWWRSRASACWRPRAAARLRRRWTCRARPARAARAEDRRRDARGRRARARLQAGLRARPLARAARHRKAALRPRAQPAPDLSHPAMAVNLDACIQCTRCVRACREEQVNDVIGYAFRGAHSRIVFDLEDPMGESTCVACGECVQACPTGALAPAQRRVSRAGRPARWPRCARTAAWAASSPTTSRTTRSSASKAATGRPTTSACA